MEKDEEPDLELDLEDLIEGKLGIPSNSHLASTPAPVGQSFSDSNDASILSSFIRPLESIVIERGGERDTQQEIFQDSWGGGDAFAFALQTTPAPLHPSMPANGRNPGTETGYPCRRSFTTSRRPPSTDYSQGLAGSGELSTKRGQRILARSVSARSLVGTKGDRLLPLKQRRRTRSVDSPTNGGGGEGCSSVASRRSLTRSNMDMFRSSSSFLDESQSVPTFFHASHQLQLPLDRDKVIESLSWFSFHTPKCVYVDLTTYELETRKKELLQQLPKKRGENNKSLAESKRGGSSFVGSASTLGADDTVTSGSMSSLSHDATASLSKLSLGDDGTRSTSPARSRAERHVLPIPHTVRRECSLVFVDISGFTKLSRMLDPESVSKIINSYFQMLVDEVVNFGGDVLKFAGDAFFAEFRVTTALDIDDEELKELRQQHPSLRSIAQLRASAYRETGVRNLAESVLAASLCAASMVEKYSDFLVQTTNDPSISFGKEQEVTKDLMLNVHCGVGVGTLVGLHVSDQSGRSRNAIEQRREFLFLGKPIDQVSDAADAAKDGQVFVSKEALSALESTCRMPESLQETSMSSVCIAERSEMYIRPKAKTMRSKGTQISQFSRESQFDALSEHGKHLEEASLERLYRQLRLYVHPVVRDDGFNGFSPVTSPPSPSTVKGQSNLTLLQPAMQRSTSASQVRRAGSELRAVYVMFVKAIMCPALTGDENVDSRLFNKLQSIMHVTSRELTKFRGHLRQFIVDDKGIVLIATFGLRGSTFANMVGDHALPATFTLHNCLKSELGVENRIGATFGKAYCGVVGGSGRGEFVVMGAAVNLAARLMYSPKNNGILVDEAVQAHADARFAFQSLPPVEAKGYDKPVIIFEPLHAVPTSKKKAYSHGHIGRLKDVEKLEEVATQIMEDPNPSQTIMAFIIGESGMGKTTLGNCVCDSIRRYAALHSKRIIVARSTSTETEKRIPLSSFKKIFLVAIRELCLHDGTLSVQQDDQKSVGQPRLTRRGSIARVRGRRMSMRGHSPTRIGLSRRNLGRMDSLASISSHPLVNVPYLTKLCDVCEKLKYPFEFADIVGSQLLSLEGALPTTQVDGRIPSIDEIVDFLTMAYITLTDFADLIVINLDDFQWIDSLTWKVIRLLCARGKNIFLMGAMRSKETQALRRMSSILSWHGEMQSRIIEVPLGPLELSEIKEATSRVLDCNDSIIDDALCTDIYSRTGGLPVYVIELLEGIKRKKTVAIDEVSGKLRWTEEAQREQNRIGQNRVADIELSFLERFDSLDPTVRSILQTCAVLGISFAFSDVIRVHPDMDETEIGLALNTAVDELILVEDIEDEDEDDMSLWSADESLIGSRATPNQWMSLEDRFFHFSHTMWRKSVLDKMLKEQKMDLHRQIAEGMEKEQVLIMESSDIGRLLTLFDHWKSCADFSKAAPLALAVGLRLEEWDLAAQSLDVYRDALEMCYESAERNEDKAGPLPENELWLHASAPTTTLEFILRLHIRIAKCHAHLGEQEQCATAFEDAYRIMATSTEASRFNRDLLIPIISGLCSIAIQRGFYEDGLNREDLVAQFVEEAKKHDEEFHLCRAYAMEATFRARLGEFEQATASVERLKALYKTEKHSIAIREEYGKDYAAQCLAESTQWFCEVEPEDRTKTEEHLEYVVSEILPHIDPRDIDCAMECTFPVLMLLKELGRSEEAEAILFNNVINPFHDFGGSNSFWLKFFNPLAYLLEIVKMEKNRHSDDVDMDMVDEIEFWAIDGENSIFAHDLQKRGNIVVGEICWRIASIRLARRENAEELLERGRMLLARVVFARDEDQSDRFMVECARRLFAALDAAYDDETDEDEDEEFSYYESSTDASPNGVSNGDENARRFSLEAAAASHVNGRRESSTSQNPKMMSSYPRDESLQTMTTAAREMSSRAILQHGEQRGKVARVGCCVIQ